MTRVFHTLAWAAFLLAVWVAFWMGISFLPTVHQPLAASVIGIAAGVMAERRHAEKATAETAKRHKADIQEIGQAALALARDLDAANLEIKRLREAVKACPLQSYRKGLVDALTAVSQGRPIGGDDDWWCGYFHALDDAEKAISLLITKLDTPQSGPFF